MTVRNLFACAMVSSMAILCQSSTLAKPLKVYILAGQYNMEGHASVSTFDYIGKTVFIVVPETVINRRQ